MLKWMRSLIQKRNPYVLMARRYGHQNIISIVGGLLLVILTIAAGVSVYSVMERQAEILLTKTLAVSLQNRVDLFKDEIGRAFTNTRIVATRPAVVAALKGLDHAPRAARNRAFLQKVAISFLVYGFRAVSFQMAGGGEVAQAGHFVRGTQLRFPINTLRSTTLVWKGQFFLQTHMPVTDRRGRDVGSILTESRLPLLTRALIQSGSIGKSAALAVCAPLGADMRCVAGTPNKAGTQGGRVFTRVARAPHGHALPMDYALNGRTGVIFTRNFLHKEVVAAYAPVGQLGLGMVLLVDQMELDGPITAQLRIIAPLLMVLTVIGVLLLRGMITPLVRELAQAQRETQASETESRAEDAVLPEENWLRSASTPARVVAVAGLIVLVCEFLIMVALNILEPLFRHIGSTFWTFINPITLTAIASPALYLLIFRPMRHQQMALEGQIEVLRHNKQLDMLIGAIPDGVFLKDGAGRWLIINESAETLFRLRGIPWRGKTEKELMVLTPALRAAHEECLASDEAAWQFGHLLVGEESVTMEDGRAVILETRKMPMFGVDGQRMGLAIIARDITERRRVQQELQVAAVAFETGEGILITDRDARILRVNRAFMRLTGYSADEMIGQTPAMFHSGRQDAEFYRELWAILIRDRYWQGEIWNRRKDGAVYLEWQTITAVVDAKNEVSHYVGVSTDITLRKQAEDDIQRMAFYDSLTQLPNRSLLWDRLQQAQAYGTRHKAHGALLFMDLDHFKTINDTRGHHIGDLLLIEVATRLQESVRRTDTVARLGGDEFVAVLVGLSADSEQAAIQAQGVGQKILAALSRPYDLPGGEHHGSASMGVSLFMGSEKSTADLLKDGDAAMYQAKSAGRNTLRFFSPVLQAQFVGRAALEADLWHALALSQLALHYQAQVDDLRGIVGAEALLRWQHPERGLILPREFMALAEDAGLMVSIENWALQQACAQLEVWQADPQMRHLGLSVKIGAHLFRQPDFTVQVVGVLGAMADVSRRLTIELTESLVLDNVADSIDKMTALRHSGVRLCLCDFGTGPSSLTYLHRLPLDQIKIDRSLVRDITLDGKPNDTAALLVETIVEMAEGLGLDLVAEGVETQQQRDFLKRAHYHLYQGDFFGVPMPIVEFAGQARDGSQT
ncbi:MAG: putative bifunctional diguanylate cyclase/phosphodiesterase [Acidiferrobacter sp.]